MNVKNKNLGERWVLYIGKKTSTKFGKLVPFLFTLIAIPLGVIFFIEQDYRGKAFLLSLVMLLFVTAILCFERRYFYVIIKKQEQQIKELQEN